MAPPGSIVLPKRQNYGSSYNFDASGMDGLAPNPDNKLRLRLITVGTKIMIRRSRGWID